VSRRSHLTPYYFLVAGVLLQGLSPVFTKLLLADLSHATVVAARYLLAVGFLFPFGFRHQVRASQTGKPTRRDWVALFLVGALGSGFAALLFTAAIDYSHAGIANAISKTAPIFVAFFAYFTLREQITWARFSLVVMMVAAAVLIGVGELSFGMATARQHLLGDALALAAGVLRAAAEILGKSALRKFMPSTVALWRFGVGFLITGVISLGGGEYVGLMQLDVHGWALLLVLAAVSTSLSMFLYYRGLAEIPAHVAVTLKLVGAIVTAVVSWIVLKEALNAYHISGIGVLVFGAYLIVMRTARQQAADVTEGVLKEPPPPPVRPWAASLKNKLALLVAAAIIITVMSGTYLAIRHTTSVINEQVRLAMGETAHMILQYQTLGEPPQRDNYQQLLGKLVHHKIQGRAYSVDIVYVALLGGDGAMIAHAADPAIRALTAEGKRQSPDYDILGVQLLELIGDRDFKSSQDIIPLTAELEGYPQLLKMGCRKSIARRTAAEITVRYFTLALLLVIVGILATTYLVGHLTRPLERLTAAAGRIADGDLSAPLLMHGQDEVHSLSDSMARILGDLQMATMLRRGVLRATTDETRRTTRPELPLPPVVLVLDVRSAVQGPDEAHAGVEQLLNSFVVTVFQHEGEIYDYGQGRIIVGWGSTALEQDDVLRAVLAGIEVATVACPEIEQAEAASAWLLVDYLPPALSDHPAAELGEQLAETSPACALYVTNRAYMEVEPHIKAKPSEVAGFYEVIGLRGDDTIRQIAESTDE